MKQFHNVRVRANSTNRETVDEILNKAEAMARKREEDIIERTIREEQGIWQGEVWIDHQQPVRKFVSTLKEGLGAKQIEELKANHNRHLDTGTHFFIHLKKESFLENKFEMALGGDNISIRLNVAAFPANKENAAKVISEFFS